MTSDQLRTLLLLQKTGFEEERIDGATSFRCLNGELFTLSERGEIAFQGKSDTPLTMLVKLAQTDCGTHHPSYPLIMGGAQSKPAMSVGTPSIARHLIYWIPDRAERKAWVRHIEAIILTFYDQLVEQNANDDEMRLTTRNGHGERLHLFDNSYSVDPLVRTTGESLGDLNRHQVARFSFNWQTMPVKASFELHQEYFTLTSIIDLSLWGRWNTLSDTFSGVNPQANALKNAIEHFSFFAKERYAAVREGQASNEIAPEDRQILEPTYRTIYHDIWNKWEQQFCARPFGVAGWGPIRKIYGDLRSFTFTKGEDTFVSFPHDSARHKLRARFQPDECPALTQAIQPFLRMSGEEGEKLGYTFSRILDGSCLHGSALGAEPEILDRDHKPLTEIFCASSADHPVQLGRQLDRSNVLGTVRLAALYDLKKFSGANEELRKIENDLRVIAEEFVKELTTDFGLKLAEAHRALANAGKADNGDEIVGGIPHRVERSLYYIHQFKHLVSDLRLGRIEGWQVYDEFVRRRLGRSFEFIEIVGKRHERVRQEINSLSQQVRTRESSKLQEQTRRHAARVVDLQSSAEAAFWFFLFPYYFGAFWAELLKDWATSPWGP